MLSQFLACHWRADPASVSRQSSAATAIATRLVLEHLSFAVALQLLLVERCRALPALLDSRFLRTFTLLTVLAAVIAATNVQLPGVSLLCLLIFAFESPIVLHRSGRERVNHFAEVQHVC